jgi:hypothetical protein
MAIVLLMSVVPLIKLGSGPVAVVAVVALATFATVLAGLLRRGWPWYATWLVPGFLIAAGGWRPASALLGLLFAGVWAYVLRVRRAVLGPVSKR